MTRYTAAARTAMATSGAAPLRRLLHYDIVREIGRGAMGVVYEARDTRLDRRVAVKLLSSESVSNSERRQRFVHEARAASSLNHPNIVTVHDINADAGVEMIVMEHVDGRPLDQLITATGLRGPVALKYGIQIADALAAAHDAGIVHRDIKPSNIMVGADGRVKVLDFGLARVLDRSAPLPDASTHSAVRLTADGVVVGTVPYMSPEQAEGLPVDARSDIFSFGALLYEMLTGRRAFAAESAVATMAKILNEDPKPLGGLVPSLPADLAKIVSRCLRKDPARRYQHMSDVRMALEEIQEDWGSASHATVSATPSRRRAVAAAMVLVIAVTGYMAWRWARHEPKEGPPQIVELTTFAGAEQTPTFAPDGEQVAFSWCGEAQDNDDIYVQRIGSGPPLRLTTDPAVDFGPAWSPDGNWIAFLRGELHGRSELRLVAPLGGRERKVADVTISQSYPSPPYLSWLPDSRALVVVDSPGGNAPDELFVVSIDTGDRRPLSTTRRPGRSQNSPAVSPDGRSVVFAEGNELYVTPLAETPPASAPPRRLTDRAMAAIEPAWSNDGKSIIVSARGRLWRLNVSDERDRAQLPYVGDSAFMPAVARGRPGTPLRLVYVRGAADSNIWRLTLPEPGARASAAAVAIASTRTDAYPQLSPQEDRIAFQSARSGGKVQVWLADASGANPMPLTSATEFAGSARFSPDGRKIAFDTRDAGNWDIHVISVSGGKDRRITSDPSDEVSPSFSLDGEWIYFASNRTGRYEVWKRRLSGEETEQVTRDGGFMAIESDDGYIYYTQAEVGTSALWRIPTGGRGEARKLVDGVADRTFAIIPGGIYYIESVPDRPAVPLVLSMSGRPVRNPVGRLRYLDLRSLRSVVVSDDFDGIALGLTASRDGRNVLFTRVDSPTSDLILVDAVR